MSTETVLAAALALRDFTVGQLAAYCDEEPTDVVRMLRATPGIAARAEDRRWTVVNVTGVRERLLAHAPGSAVRGPIRGDRGAFTRDVEAPGADARLLRAEETLIECADEASAAARRAMAATAMSYLRQYVAARVLGTADWWHVDLGRPQVDEALSAAGAAVNPARVRVDAALASLTVSEASGDPVSWELIMHAAGDVGHLPGSMETPRLRPILDRFLDLVGEAAPDATGTGDSAPARMLSAVAWRRVRARVEDSVEAASTGLLPVLRWMEDTCTSRAGDAELYRVVDRFPDGGARVAVYCDLLELVPRQFQWHSERELVPGVLVGAVTDRPTAEHLESCANRLHRDLVHSPFGSQSALIGQAAHVIGELAASTASLDTEIGPRADRTRMDLLSLVNVPARGAGTNPWARS